MTYVHFCNEIKSKFLDTDDRAAYVYTRVACIDKFESLICYLW
jgi:hypothetical protein